MTLTPSLPSTPSTPSLTSDSPQAVRSLLERWHEILPQVRDLPAMTSAGTSYSYAEADRLSDLAAVELVEAAGPGDAPIGVLADHTAEATLALLTVLKTGRMHVFLDPHVPVDRLRYYLTAAGVELCLTTPGTASVADELADDIRTSIDFSNVLARAAASTTTPEALAAETEVKLALGRSRRGTDAVCIVFTSGSTGLPKGVVQTHDSVGAQVDINRSFTDNAPGDRVLLAFSLGFVAGLTSFFSPLLNGAGVWCYDAREGGIAALEEWIESNALTGVLLTPFLGKSLAESMPDGKVFERVRYVVTGSEAITASGLTALRSIVPSSAFYVNVSGSSETGCVITQWRLNGDEAVPTGVIPVGYASLHAEILIWNDEGESVPQGEVGEIVFVSNYLSGGYWKNDERNAAQFGTAPDGRRLYRTGDLGRLDAEGNLFMAGRADAAVKVRGYLVEPSEIEAALSALVDISDAVVVAQKFDEKPTRLIAYVVPTPGLRAPSTPALRRALRETLPEYMVPSEIVKLTALPRTERGKVDRLQLPPVPERVISDKALDQHEYVMAQIWCRILEIPGLDVEDDFMALGGDSLSAEELLAAVEDDLGVTLASSDILTYPTLGEFTKRVVNHESALPGDPDVVSLNTGTGGRPLFCIAGAGALALTYLPLSRQFPERDVYAFQAHAMEKRGLPDRTLPAMAARVIRTMRVVQPHGPYTVVGHSFGGFVALEVAKQLRRGGEEVDMVVLLDTFPPNSQGDRQNSSPEELESISAQVVEAQTKTKAVRPLGVPGLLPQKVTSLMRKQFERILPDGLPERDQLARHLRAHLAGILTYEGQKQFDASSDHTVLAMRKHVMEPYDGEVLYVMAKTNDLGLDGWKETLVGGFYVETVDTDHTSFLRDPEVKTLAGVLRDYLAPVGALVSK